MRQRLILAGAIVLALCGSFAAGRYTRTVQTRDEHKATTEAKATSVATAETHAATAAKTDATKDVDTRSHTVVRWLPAVAAKDGCPAIPAHVEQETDVETHAASKRTSESRSDKSSAGKVTQASETHQSVVTLHTVESRPNWSASVLAGAQLGGRNLLVPAPFVGGIIVQRRVLGPVFVGIWGTTGMAGGVGVGASW